MKRHIPRGFVVVTVASTVVLTVGACDSGESAGAAASTAAEAASSTPLPSKAPDTFGRKANWSSAIAGGSTPAVGALGVLAAVPSGTEGAYRVASLDLTDGSVQWSSGTFSASEPPRVAWSEQAGRTWAIVTTAEDEASVRVRAYDAQAGGTNTAPTAEEVFSASEGAESAPRVTAGLGGVLISGSSSGSVQYWPATGEVTVYKGIVSRGGGQAGVPVAIFDDGWVLSYPPGGFAFATTSGGWESTSVAPEGSDAQGGDLLSTSGDVLVADWGDGVLAVHDVRTGRVLAKAEGVDEDAVPDGSPIARSEDGRWLAIGSVAFDLKAGEGARFVDDSVLVARSIREDVVYADAPASDEGAEAEASAIDLTTRGQVGAVPTLVPRGFTDGGLGVFVGEKAEGEAVLYAAPLR